MATPEGNAPAASSSNRVSGTCGNSKSVGTPGGYAASHGWVCVVTAAQPDDGGAGDEFVVVLSTLTSLNGSRRSAHGNTRRKSSASTATRSTALPANLPGRPPGRRLQIQTYITRLRASVGRRLCQRSGEDTRGLVQRVGEHRVDDVAVAGRVLRMAGGERQQLEGRLRDGVGLVRHRVGDLDLRGHDDLPPRNVGVGHVLDRVGEPLGLGFEHDHVVVSQRRDLVERVQVCRPVPGNCEVAHLTRQRRARIVARPLLQVLVVSALDDDEVVVPAEARDVEDRDPGAEAHLVGLEQRDIRPVAGPLLLQTMVDLVLLLLGVDAGEPQLIGDEQQDHDAAGDQQLPDAPRRRPPAVTGRALGHRLGGRGGRCHAAAFAWVSSSGPSYAGSVTRADRLARYPKPYAATYCWKICTSASASSERIRSSGSPTAITTNGGPNARPCSSKVLPTQRTALVATTRWPMMVIAWAPPAHSALTTPCTSCWWITRSSGCAPAARSRSTADRGASSSDTVTAGPTTGVSPAAAASLAACAWAARIRVSVPAAAPVAAEMAARRVSAWRVSAAMSRCASAMRWLTPRVGLARRSVPCDVTAEVTSSSIAAATVTGTSARHTRRLRGWQSPSGGGTRLR